MNRHPHWCSLVLAGLLLSSSFLGCTQARPAAAGGNVTAFLIPTANSNPTGIALGPEGNLWFTEQTANKIGRLHPATGQIDEFPLPVPNSHPFAIVRGPDNALWFTQQTAGLIGRISTNGAIAEFRVPGGGNPLGITLGANNLLSFTTDRASWFGQLQPATGSIQLFMLPALGRLYGIAASPNNTVWVGDQLSNAVWRFSPATGWSRFPIPTPNSMPTQMQLGPDGNLYVAERNARAVAQVTPTGRIVEIPLTSLDPGAAPAGLAVCGGTLCFNDANAGALDRFDPATGALSVAASVASGNQGLACLADGSSCFSTNPEMNTIVQEILCETIGATGAPATTVANLHSETIWVANLTDSDGPGGDEQIAINWGDGSPNSEGTLHHVGATLSSVEGTHMYKLRTIYTVTTTITDPDATPGEVTATVHVTVN
jgi:virginiamycin B lyase